MRAVLPLLPDDTQLTIASTALFAETASHAMAAVQVLLYGSRCDDLLNDIPWAAHTIAQIRAGVDPHSLFTIGQMKQFYAANLRRMLIVLEETE